jgi:Ca-activated chloride channel family protein
MVVRTLAAILLVAIPCLAALQAQPTFRSAVDLVTLQVSVTAKDGTRIGELKAGDFRVYEDGVLHEVSVVSHEARLLSLCILLDSSPSMAGREVLATTAINTLFKELRDEDEVALLMFAWKPRVALGWTKAPDARSFSWKGWRLSLGTSLLDAMKEALTQLERATNPQPVILIVSDGGENTSGTRLAELVSTRRQSETAVYGIRTERPPLKRVASVARAMTVDYLPDIVGDSGGTVFRARDAESAAAAAHAFVDELRAQYTIGYVPKRRPDGRYRQVKVETTNPAFVVRHRGGYLAAPH